MTVAATTTDDDRQGALRVTIVGPGGPAIADLLCPTAVQTESLRDAVSVTTDVLVLYSETPSEELAALSRLPVPPVLVVVSSPGALSTVVRRLRRRLEPEPAAPVGHPALSSPAPELSPREVEIMRLVAAGLTNAGVAQRLGLAEKTVRNRVSQIYLKLGVRTRTEAVVRWKGANG